MHVPREPVMHVWSSSPTRRRAVNLEMSDRFKFALGLRLRRLVKLSIVVVVKILRADFQIHVL